MLLHLGIISVFFVVVVPSLDRTFANFSNDITATLLVWNSGINKLKSILSPCETKANVHFFFNLNNESYISRTQQEIIIIIMHNSIAELYKH